MPQMHKGRIERRRRWDGTLLHCRHIVHMARIHSPPSRPRWLPHVRLNYYLVNILHIHSSIPERHACPRQVYSVRLSTNYCHRRGWRVPVNIEMSLLAIRTMLVLRRNDVCRLCGVRFGQGRRCRWRMRRCRRSRLLPLIGWRRLLRPGVLLIMVICKGINIKGLVSA